MTQSRLAYGPVRACQRFRNRARNAPQNQAQFVHQKGPSYRAKWVLLTYCSVAIFQGFAQPRKGLFCRPFGPRPKGFFGSTRHATKNTAQAETGAKYSNRGEI